MPGMAIADQHSHHVSDDADGCRRDIDDVWSEVHSCSRRHRHGSRQLLGANDQK